MFVSYAQNYEDVMLWRALKDVKEGFYIDVGANHPTIDSVTKAFYDRGWSGINIEPIEQWFNVLCNERSRDINLLKAASNKISKEIIFEVVGTGLSSFVQAHVATHSENNDQIIKKIEIETDTLTNIYQKISPKVVHFLKIDVEGAEKEVLEGIDFTILRPWIIVVESTIPNTNKECHEQWEHIITKNSYSPCYFDGLNRYYISEEKKDLQVAFNSPPNYFDHFITAKVFELEKVATNFRSQQFKIDQYISEISYLRNELSYYKAAEQKALEKLKAVHQSNSWRITLPIRIISESIGRIFNVQKKLIYQIFLKILGFLFEYKMLKATIIRLLTHQPLLKNKVKNLLDHLECNDLGNHSTLRSVHIQSDLTPRAQDIYKFLKQSFSIKGDKK